MILSLTLRADEDHERVRKRPDGKAPVADYSLRHGSSHQQRKDTSMKKILIVTLAVMTATVISAKAGDVKELWEKNCVKCHGADGKGETKMGKKSGVKDMTDAKYQAELKDDKAFKAIKEGLKDGDKTLMKPAEGLSDEDIKALIAHVHTYKT